MNKRIFTALPVLAFSIFQLNTAANDIEPTKEFYTATHVTNAIAINGDLAASEWGGVPVLADPKFAIPKGSSTNGTLVLFELCPQCIPNTPDWTGPDDQTSAVQIVWDIDNVYFGFVVTDDYHENSANSAWNGDSVQLMIADAPRTNIVALYNYALGGVEGALGAVIVEHQDLPNNRGPSPGGDPACGCPTEAVVTRNSTTKKTIYEIRLPAASLGLTAPLQAGTKFGLGMAINDGDELAPGQGGWGGLGAHSIVFGKTPEETALVTLGANFPTVDRIFLSAINPAIDAFSFRANDKGASIVAPASAKLIIDSQTVPLTASPKVGATDFAYVPATPFLPNTAHTYSIDVKDTQGNSVTDSGNFTTPRYALLTAADKVTADTSKPGFIWKVHQNNLLTTDSTDRPLNQLAGLLGQNFADPNAQGVALAAGTPGANNQLPITFEIPAVLNLNIDSSGLGDGDFTPDDQMPGIPGLSPAGPTDGIAAEITTYLEVPAGKYTLIVNSDDGFRTTTGSGDNDVFQAKLAGEFQGGRAPTDTACTIYALEAGIYPFRTVWEQGVGGGSIEWKLVKSDGTKVLLNDVANGGWKAYRAATTAALTVITAVSPAANASKVQGTDPIQAAITEGATTVNTATAQISLDGNPVATTATRAGNIVTLKHQPATAMAAGTHTAQVTFTHGGTTRTEQWSFSVPPVTLDKLHSYLARVFGTAAFTPDRGGHTAQAGDYAIDFGSGSAARSVLIPDASFVNATAANDVMTFSLWIKKHDNSDSSAFWADSPSSQAGERGFQAHTPWSDNVVYFDTAGNAPDTSRISDTITNFPAYTGDAWWTNLWHHWAFIKNVGTKQIWIDGQLFLEGPPSANSDPLPTDFTRIWLGAEGGGPDAGVVNNMHGLIDDFAVFGTALTQAQVQQLASGTLPSALPASAKPLAYWDFNDVTITRPPVAIARSGATITLSWPNATGFRLVSSDTVKGTYTDVQGVTGNSYTINNPTGTKFYYLIK